MVPSVQGEIVAHIKLEDGTYTVELVSPEGTTAVVGIPKASISPRTIEVNGSTIWVSGTFVGNAPGITWSGEDENHMKFQVAPGAWTISAKAE